MTDIGTAFSIGIGTPFVIDRIDMLDPTHLMNPAWEEFALHSRGGLIYAQQQLDVPTIDVSQFVESYSLTESIREVARILDFTLDTANMPDAWRVHAGSDLMLYGNSINRSTGGIKNGVQFSGKVYTSGRRETPGVSLRTYRAYDFLTMLARTEDILVYTKKTMTEIVLDVCSRYGIPTGTIVDTETPVGQIIQGSGTSVAQVIEEAAQRTLRRAQRKFFVRCTDDNSSLELLELGYTGVQWDLGDQNSSVMLSFEEESSFENGRTVIQLVTENSPNYTPPSIDSTNRFEVQGTRENPEDPFAITFGKLKAVITPDGTTDAPTNVEQLDAEYALRNRLVEKATTQNLILPGARQGDRVVLHLPDGTGITAYISVVISQHTANEPRQTLELIFDALGAVA